MTQKPSFLPLAAVGVLLVGAGLALISGMSASAQSVQHLTITQPGGLPGAPVMTGVLPSSNTVTVTWDGPQGYYQLFEKRIGDTQWQAVGRATNLVRRATVPSETGALFKIAGPAPKYAGAQACSACHSTIHKNELNTRHAQAFQALKRIGQATNSACLPCHTVGYGLSTGFVSETATPKLAGVQCENCHGPAGNHAANEFDPVYRPRSEIAATVCGGCHTGAQQPTYDEWKSSGHSTVVEDMNPADRIDRCGRCHSGSVRLSLIKKKPLPVGDANVELGCVVCHDPHKTNSAPAQLRNPVFSTNDYFISTSIAFTNQYKTNINICAQCHNHRGASYTSSSRAPHHSPQYNMLLGTVGELESGLPHYQPAAHATEITNQCVACHMQTAPFQSEAQPAVTGHEFRVRSYNVCLPCHGAPEVLVRVISGVVSNQIQDLKFALDLWAAEKAPASLWNKYGARAWEYTEPGDLNADATGPDATEQLLIPNRIKKARFNLYVVLYDGSSGVHNSQYALTLLDTAQTWVQQEINGQ